jgi:hypothetical protein
MIYKSSARGDAAILACREIEIATAFAIFHCFEKRFFFDRIDTLINLIAMAFRPYYS